MHCPNCNKYLQCPCESCRLRAPGEYEFWVWDGEFITCPHCKFKAHVDYWELKAYELYERNKNAETS